LHTALYSLELKQLLDQKLKPNVKAIDREGIYPEQLLIEFGRRGFYKGDSLDHFKLIEQIASVCGSTAFAVWCQTTAIYFIRSCDNEYLKQQLLPLLERGERLGGTGLSNPMKYYAGLEPIRLKAQSVTGGYVISGMLSYVSNLGPDHWFAFIAEVSNQCRIMAMIPCDAPGLKLESRDEFLGLNGTATYTCRFSNVFIPEEWIISHSADYFIKTVRANLVGNQIGLALGICHASINAIKSQNLTQSEVNCSLQSQLVKIEGKWKQLRDTAFDLLENSINNWEKILKVRLKTAYLSLDAVKEELFHAGSAGYLKDGPLARRFREAAFISVLTPTVKHLTKLIYGSK
jgi:alkylation response protein AidB-like acyl-CoA dehydrogenase